MSAPRPRPPAPGPRTTTPAAAAAAAPAAAATCTKGQTLGRPCTGSSRSTVPVQGAWRRQPGSAAPGPPIPAVSRSGPLAARPPLPRRRSGAQGIGRAVPSPAPCPRPPPRRSTPPPRALGALRRQGHGRGPLGSYAFGVSGTASPACRVASHSLPFAHAVHTTETTPTHRPSRPLPRPLRRYVPPSASQLEAAPEALEDLLHSCSLCINDINIHVFMLFMKLLEPYPA
ncbi:basic proline-rich protein-like [Penaeus chinensis]|uniref:basic proline-rich protein-like n=1 Tax=Penaeus chinensis TaxID=139456 RepID=UPI001FB73934|nr:basic proline-rich protein-like [Penaeus chinensis]